jgi:CheY-like chemotaxis protein
MVKIIPGGVPVKETASIDELLRDTATFISRGSKVRCEFSLPDNLWPVNIDVGQISQVIQNLIINAEHAMPEGGIIQISAENIVIDKDSKIPVSPGRYVKITVRDHGVGIPPEYLRKVFDPYFTTKQKGSGLGLAISYSIIKNHHGYIGVESEVGVGTAFYVYLPASGYVIPPKKHSVDIIRPLAGKGKILVMDDDDTLRTTLGKVLKSLGYDVVCVPEGGEAVEAYRKAKDAKEAFDVVILDLTVAGGMGGKEALQELLKLDPQVKAVVSSGYSNDPIIAEYTKYGFKDAVVKPYDIEKLSRVLDKIIRGNS